MPPASMSSKTHKSMRDGQRRRSLRIWALDASSSKDQEQLRPIRSKRKYGDSSFNPVSKQVWKGRDSSNHSTDFVEWRSAAGCDLQMIIQERNGKSPVMPTRHTLELVLDTLQRRDTYEIFAEPVDPDEVEDYYEIIKEPMDFGTMRAKLHEGMYKNLEQFEHDVFLIPENAMHFNSSATIYFRQARVLHELARKVIHALKTDPEIFVSEYPGARRRSMRKVLSEPKESVSDVYSKRVMNTKSPSACRNKNPATQCYATKFVTGSRDGRLNEVVADRRQTYWKSRSSFDNHQGNKKMVQMTDEGDTVWYKDSLMSYVKDLGPTAQMVAKRKLLLLGQHEKNYGSVSNTSFDGYPSILFRTFRDFAPVGSINPFLVNTKSSDVIDLTKEEDHGIKEKEYKTTDDDRSLINEKTSCNVRHVSKTNVTRNINNNDNARPVVILALENCHYNYANAADDQFNKPRNKKIAVADLQMKRHVQASSSLSTPHHQFTFDLPFLKARLNRMKNNVVIPSLDFGKGKG